MCVVGCITLACLSQHRILTGVKPGQVGTAIAIGPQKVDCARNTRAGSAGGTLPMAARPAGCAPLLVVIG